jgi:hypothetical protein
MTIEYLQECRVSRGSSVCPDHHFGQSLLCRLRVGLAIMQGKTSRKSLYRQGLREGALQIALHRSYPVIGPNRVAKSSSWKMIPGWSRTVR